MRVSLIAFARDAARAPVLDGRPVERIAAELELGNTCPADAAQVLRRVAAEARHV